MGELTWRQHAEALRDILTGTKPEQLDQEIVTSLIAHSLLRREDQTKPCRTCGKPQHDFSYWKVAAAGRLLAAALASATRPSPLRPAMEVGGESPEAENRR